MTNAIIALIPQENSLTAKVPGVAGRIGRLGCASNKSHESRFNPAYLLGNLRVMEGLPFSF
jgi:hypothetical protein